MQVVMVKTGQRQRWSGWRLLGALGAGAGLAYLFDPDRGHGRRRAARDRTLHILRHSARRLERGSRAAALQALGRARGAMYRLRPPQPGESLDDAGLAHKVESVLFRDRHVPKGKISINAENGTVFLRGEIESAELIDDVMESVRNISGVSEAVSLLHLPGTEAPHPIHADRSDDGRKT